MGLQHNAAWTAAGAAAVATLLDQFAADGLRADNFGLVALTTGDGAGPVGFTHRGDWQCYPCSLVKPFHLLHALAALAAGRLAPHDDLDRALRDMILWSSNTATNYVIDLLTQTTGDTRLDPADFAAWCDQREGLNRWFQALGWPEFAGCNLTQKLMDDTRYGREAQFAALHGGYLNVLTPRAAARLLWALFDGDLPLAAAGRARAQALLRRDPASPDAANPMYQVSEYLGAGLPPAVPLWSKAGHNFWTGDARTSHFKHDMIRFVPPGRAPVVLVLMTQGKTLCADRPQAFPRMGGMLYDIFAAASPSV